jgi:hypothetical protein
VAWDRAGRGSACAKALGQDEPGRWRSSEGAVWLEQRERGGRREEEGGDRQVVQGPVGCREHLGFEPEGSGSHGGLWAGEGGPGSWAPPGGCCGKDSWGLRAS